MSEGIMIRWRTLLIVVVLGVAALATASRLGARAQESTSTSSSTATSDTRTVSCSLLTQSEAESVLRDSVKVRDVGTMCTYSVLVPTRLKSLSVSAGPDELAPEHLSATMQSYAATANAKVRQVDGIGDDAWAAVTAQSAQLIAHKNGEFVTVMLINATWPESERIAALSEVATKALARLA